MSVIIIRLVPIVELIAFRIIGCWREVLHVPRNMKATDCLASKRNDVVDLHAFRAVPIPSAKFFRVFLREPKLCTFSIGLARRPTSFDLFRVGRFPIARSQFVDRSIFSIISSFFRFNKLRFCCSAREHRRLSLFLVPKVVGRFLSSNVLRISQHHNLAVRCISFLISRQTPSNSCFHSLGVVPSIVRFTGPALSV